MTWTNLLVPRSFLLQDSHLLPCMFTFPRTFNIEREHQHLRPKSSRQTSSTLQGLKSQPIRASRGELSLRSQNWWILYNQQDGCPSLKILLPDISYFAKYAYEGPGSATLTGSNEMMTRWSQTKMRLFKSQPARLSKHFSCCKGLVRHSAYGSER